MKRVFIIAEAGDNHNGDYNLALKLVDIAKVSGADAVKFQTFKTEKVISKYAEKADYQKSTTGSSESQFDMVKKLELSFEQFRNIKKYCDDKEILFLSTPFDLDSIDFLESLGIPIWKVPSGEVTNLPYLIKIAKTGKPIIMSTGMCYIDEIKNAINILKSNGSGDITLLHCNTEYPTPYNDVNLNAMISMKKEFNIDIGYSDHTLGIEVSVAAVALGAKVIEKHFTIDKNMEGPDHQASLEPNELNAMVKAIRNIEVSMGDGIKKPSNSEIKNIQIARKSIVANKDIFAGEIFTEENLSIKRPGSGVSPIKWYEVVGTRAKRDFKEDELIEI